MEKQTDPIQVKRMLDEIALKLNLPLEDDRVFAALLDKEIRCFSEEVYEKLLNPLYFRKEATSETLIL